MQIYRRFVEIVHIIGGGGFFYAPSQADFDNPEERVYIDKYMRGRPGVSAEERVRLFKLAWDVTGSAFAQRVTQYVSFYSGDPIRLTAALLRRLRQGAALRHRRPRAGQDAATSTSRCRRTTSARSRRAARRWRRARSRRSTRRRSSRSHSARTAHSRCAARYSRSSGVGDAARLSPTVAAAPPVDPPLTYRLTVYDRDPRELAPEGTRILVNATPSARQLLGLSPFADPCADVYVDRFGHAEISVEITADCPVGLCVSILMLPPGRPITAASDPPMVWRRAYSEATTKVDLVVRPETAPIAADARPLTIPEPLMMPFIVCPPNRPPFAEAQTVTFRSVSFEIPAGEYRWLESPSGSGAIVVCHGTNAGVRFSSATCNELARVATTNDEQQTFDAIVASCRRIV